MSDSLYTIPGGVNPNRGLNWGLAQAYSVYSATDPRTIRSLCRWKSPAGHPIPVTVTVQRTNTVERAITLDNYQDSPICVITWTVSGAQFRAEIDGAPGNALTVCADSVEVFGNAGRNDTGVGLYSAGVSPAIGRSTATRTLTFLNPVANLDIPVPPFTKWFEAQRQSLFASNMQFRYRDNALNTVGEVFTATNQVGRRHYISAHVRTLQSGVAGMNGLTVTFGIEV